MANGNEPFDDEDGDGSRSASRPAKDPLKPAAPVGDDERGDSAAPAGETQPSLGRPDDGADPRDGGSRRGADEAAPAEEPGPARADDEHAGGHRHVLSLFGKKVAVGLRWRQVVDEDEAWEFTLEAQEEGYDLWHFLAGNEPQLALGRREFGHRPGMPLLAAELAGQYPGQWAGLFEIDGAYYVSAVSSDIIDPDADVAFESFDEAYVLYEDIATRSTGLRRLVSQSLVGRVPLNGVEGIDLENRPFKFTTGLQVVSNTKRYLGFGIPIAVLAIAAFAAVKFAPDLIEDVKRRIGLTPKQEKQQVVIPPAPWAGQPKAEVAMANCLDALRSAPREAYGWSSTSLVCDGRILQVVMQRGSSITDMAPPITWLERWAKGQGELVSKNGTSLGKPQLTPLDPMKPNVATLTWRLPPVKLADRWRDGDRPTAALEGEARTLWSALEDKFIKVAFRSVQDTPYFQTRDAVVEMGFHQEGQVSPSIRKRGVFMTTMAMDPKTMNVVANVRMGLAKPFPTDENIQIIRSPDPSTTEGATLPPRPAR